MDQDPASWKHGLELGALSDLGLRRTNNQDAIAVALAASPEEWRERGHLFLVADGMGAHAAGELASRLAADTVPLAYRKLRDRPPADALQAAVEEANRQIHARGQANDDFRGMGTTASVLVLLPQFALLGQVGDSRVYRLRGGRFDQLTFDHSLVWEMAAAGQISDQEVESFIPRNIITRSLGPGPEVKVDLEGPFPLQLGDTFLLCSDGLSGPVKNPEMAALLGCLPPQEAAQSLVDLANLRGGPDNISLIVVHLAGPEAIEDSEAGRLAATTGTASRRPIPKAAWALLGAALVAGLGLLATGYHAAGGAILGLAAIGAFWRWTRRGNNPGVHQDLPGYQPLGKGPHAGCDGTPCAATVEGLAGTVGQLRNAAVRGHWALDWPPFDRLESQGAAAAVAEDYPAAIRHYGRAMSLMMGQLRRQHDAPSGGPSVLDL